MSVTAAILETGGQFKACANCQQPLTGAYCALCGQPRDVHRRSVWGLLHELGKDIASFDSRILRTARALMLRPGELAKAYHEGRTQPFVPPVRLYLFVSLVFFLALSTAHIAIFQFGLGIDRQVLARDAAGHVFLEKDGKRTQVPNSTALSDGSVFTGGHVVKDAKIGDPAYHAQAQLLVLRHIGAQRPMPADVRAQLDKLNADVQAQNGDDAKDWGSRVFAHGLSALAKNPAALNGPMTEWLPRILFLLMPLFALLLSLFYWRRRANLFFVDHLVFALNYHSFGFVLLVLFLAPAQIMSQSVLMLLICGIMMLYLLLAMKRFYGESWRRTAMKCIAVSFVYLVLVLLPALLGLLVMSMIDV